MNGPENELSSTLQRQAEQFARRGGTDLDLAQVVSRAGEIRRGRRMRATMVMAAVVLAIAVPVGVTVLDSNPTRPREIAPAETTTPVDSSPLTLDGLETGAAAGTGYVVAGTLRAAGVDPIDVSDLGETVEVARINGGFLVASASEVDGSTTATFVADDGTRGETWPYAAGFGVSGDRSVGALVQPDGTVVAIQDRGSRAYEIGTLPGSGGAYTVASVTGPDCAPSADPSGCVVYVNDGGQTARVWVLTPGQEPTELGNGFQALAGADTVLAGQTSVDDLEPSSCSKATSTGFDELWSTCDYSLESFSPVGDHLLAGPSYQSGGGDGQLAILDSLTGKVVLSLRTSEDVQIWDARWEDDSHVLAVLGSANTYAVVRIGLDGSRELVGERVPGADDFVSPIRLG